MDFKLRMMIFTKKSKLQLRLRYIFIFLLMINIFETKTTSTKTKTKTTSKTNLRKLVIDCTPETTEQVNLILIIKFKLDD